MRRYGLLLLLIALFFLLAGCDTGEQAADADAAAAAAEATPSITPSPVPPTETSTPTPTSTETPVPVTVEPTPTRQALPEELKMPIWEVQAGAASVRGLSPMTDVPEALITRQQFRDMIKKELEANDSKEEMRLYVRQLWLLRLAKDPSIDWYEVSADLYSDGILGYYDPTTKEMFIITDKKELDPESSVTVAHEYVHNLQDQNYHLDKMMPKDNTDQDRIMAYRSLVEGDATLSGYAWAATFMGEADYDSLFGKRESISPDVINRTPRYLGEGTIFPYSEGTNFVSEIIKVGGFSTVNVALSDPPRSTEQIMHPEKFLKTPIDQPVVVSLPPLTDTLGAGWTFKETNTLGEFDLKIMLEENGAGDPSRGAAGWGGARYADYQNGDTSLLYTLSTWDTEMDAVEFEGAMGETFSKYPKDGDFWTDAGRFFAMKRTGFRVLFVASTDKGAVERAMSAK
ncbi:MAG TPA: hypothetical protein VGE45_05440 [Chloroflexia bacterium]|jgi:hypothetical protein